MTAEQQPLIMIIDDRRDILRHCERCLGEHFTFMHVPGGRPGLVALRKHPVSAILLDRDFSQANPDDLIGPRMDVRDEGLHILEQLRAEHPDLPVIMVTGHRDLATAVRATRLKADFVAWEDIEAEPAILAARLQRALEKSQNGNGVGVAAFRKLGIVAESPSIRSVLASLFRAVPGSAPICLLGPTGTGKDTLAYGVHCLSGDARRPFVVVNVASIAPTLIEAELFGKVHGAHNDARESLGLIRAAHGGTLFLNEIGRLPLEHQAKLLTALDRHEVTPVGGVRPQAVNFRLITATSRDLHALVETGDFQRDLFHRIAWHIFVMPSLAARPDDIAPLAHSFLRGTEAFKTKQVIGFAKEAIEYLLSLPWPGNVRELQGMVEACAVSAMHTITVADIDDVITRSREDVYAGPATNALCQGGIPDDAGSDPRASEERVFGTRSLDGVKCAYYFYLKKVEGANLARMAQRAVVAKSTMYEWRQLYDKPAAGCGDQMSGEA